MLTEVTFTVTSSTGNLIRLIAAARRAGFKTFDQRVEKGVDSTIDKIKMVLESDRPILVDQLSQIGSIVPTLLDIKIATTDVIETPADFDIAAFVKTEGQRLVSAYPNIARPLQMLEDAMPASQRTEILLKLGHGIGRWQYRKRFSLGGRLTLDKVVQRSLKLALSDFVSVTAYKTTLAVTDCPHCATRRKANNNDCDFITGFIEGFLGEMHYLGNPSVNQTHSKATGARVCEFEVSA